MKVLLIAAGFAIVGAGERGSGMAEIRAGTSPDGRVTYRETGAASDRAIVFLHGIGGGARLFDAQLSALGAAFRAIAWNMPGYGGSRPVDAPGIDGYAAALARFLADLGLAEPVLVGHSIGGMIVQAYLADGRGPAAGIVLAQTTPAFGGKDPRWAEDFVRARLAPLETGTSMAALAAASVMGMVGPDPDPAGVALARDVIAATPVDAYRASTLSMIGFDRRAALSAIAVPALLVAGSEDRNAPAPTMAKMAAAIPGARLLTLEGCGHLVMAERPAAFTQAVRDFAAGLPDARKAA